MFIEMGPVGSALLATLIISLAPTIVLFFIPIFSVEKGKKGINKKLLRVLVSFAVGGLLGDAFLHLLPHSFEPHSHIDHHSHEHQHLHSDHVHHQHLHIEDHSHKHSHSHDKDHKHSHDKDHKHSHSHDKDHKHSHSHDKDHKHSHDKDHKHSHSHDKDHKHSHEKDHKHSHDKDHKHSHSHDKDHKHSHSHDKDHKHSHSHSDESNGYSTNPDAVHEHHHHEHDHSLQIRVGLFVLLGMLTFFVIQKYAASRSSHSHGHSHVHVHPTHDSTSKQLLAGSTKKKPRRSSDELQRIREEQKAAARKASSILNIIADAAHNFTDGMAIAASFLVSNQVGMTTSLAVLFHEVPHEIGDYAILIQNGFSWYGAMLMQCFTAIGAFIGCLVGLYFAQVGEAATTWILPFTAGGFIYIATVDIIPDLLEDTSFKQTVIEIFAMSIGVGFMVIIAMYE